MEERPRRGLHGPPQPAAHPPLGHQVSWFCFCKRPLCLYPASLGPWKQGFVCVCTCVCVCVDPCVSVRVLVPLLAAPGVFLHSVALRALQNEAV